MKGIIFLYAMILIASCLGRPFQAKKTMVVSVPVTDLRSIPAKAQPNLGIDDNELTQLLYNEPVVVLDDTKPGWKYVEALQQKEMINSTWTGYLGWVEDDHLVDAASLPPSYNLVVKSNWSPIFKRACNPYGCTDADLIIKVSTGTLLNGLEVSPPGWWLVVLPQNQKGWIRVTEVRKTLQPEIVSKFTPAEQDALRKEIVEQAHYLLGWYYLWGGRSSFNGEMLSSGIQATGVDCSGLVSLSYRSFGLLLPRDANEIFLKSKNVTAGPLALRTGDVLFAAHPKTPNHMYHVMMVLDETFIIESSYGTEPNDPHNGTRIVTAKQKFGVELRDAKWGHLVPSGSYLYWGSYFPWTLHW